MRNLFRYGMISLIGALIVLTGFGCKGLSEEEQQATKQVELEFWTVYDDVNVLNELVKEYTAPRNYLKINIRQLRPDEIYNRLVEALAEDKGPDIISVNNHELGAYLNKLLPAPQSVKDALVYVEKGQFSDNVIVKTGIKEMVTLDKLEKEYVKVVKNDAYRNGKLYGLPLSLDLVAIYYNKDLLDKAGIAEPPKTWQEFQEDVKVLTKFDKSSGKIVQAGAALGTGSNITGSSDLLYILFEQSNINFINEKTGLADFHNVPRDFVGAETPGAAVLNFYTDFANPSRDTYSWNDSMSDAFETFVSGQTAFFFGYSYHHPQIKARAPQMNFDIIPMLQLSEEKNVNAANYYLQTVLSKSKHPNEAWAFVDFLTHSPATKKYLEKTGRPTALRAYVSEQRKNPALDPFASQVLTAGSWYKGKNYEAANKAIQDMFKEWLQEVPGEKVFEWRRGVLNRAASKVNQTY